VRHIGRWRSPVPHPSTRHSPSSGLSKCLIATLLHFYLAIQTTKSSSFLPSATLTGRHSWISASEYGSTFSFMNKVSLWTSRLTSAFISILCGRSTTPPHRHATSAPRFCLELSAGLRHRRYDPTATHFLLRSLPSLLPIGTVRAVKVIGQGGSQDHIYYKLGRLAVIKSYRRHRFGRDLVLALHKWVKEDTKRSYDHLEVTKVIAHSQIPVKPFYSKYVPGHGSVPFWRALITQSHARYGYLPEVIFTSVCYQCLIDTNGAYTKTGRRI